MATQKASPKTTRSRNKAAPITPEAVAKVLEGGNVPITDEQRAAEQAEETRLVQAGRRSTDAMAFAVSQMMGPAAVPQAAAPNIDEFQKRVQEIANEMGVPAPVAQAAVSTTAPTPAPTPAPQAAPTEKIVKNGPTRPAQDTLCGRIWAAADEITVKTGGAATMPELRGMTSLSDVNEHTLKTQYARWRQFNGVTGRITKGAPKAAKVMDHDGYP